jgi:hypothetical protein
MTHTPSEKSLLEALADAITATRAAIPPDAPRSTDIPALQSALINISEIAENRLSEIRALSIILLDWLRIPASHNKTTVFANVLNIIWERAETMQDDLYNLVEEVGCCSPGLNRDPQARIEARKTATTAHPH